jgi:hypothetical protein
MFNRIQRFFGYRFYRYQQNNRIVSITKDVNEKAVFTTQKPVLLFNASTRIIGLSQNASFSLLTNWKLKLAGVPTVQFVCRAAMHPCVLGTDIDAPGDSPPCKKCMHLSDAVYAGQEVVELTDKSVKLDNIEALSVDELISYSYNGFPVGEIVVPSLRWITRRHHLINDEKTRDLFRRYIRAAVSFYEQFSSAVDEIDPQAVVLFNGMFFPEATLKWIARKRGISTYTHEVALRPLTAFFTSGEATAYPIDLPEDFQLSREQEEKLDAYLADRMKGDFTMAGIQFWPDMKGLDAALLEKIEQYKGVIPVFTNVIFDTSQVHANVLFETMFAWLDSIAELIRETPDHLFVIRAHPDEIRPGKASAESVADWFVASDLANLPNVVFIPPEETFSSYELIQRAKFVMVYNSTIGLEASIMGAAVICAGKSRYTQNNSVYFPKNLHGYHDLVKSMLKSSKVQAPAEHQRNARNFLYVQLFETGLPMHPFLENDPYLIGYTGIKDISVDDLSGKDGEVLDIIAEGILKGKSFLWKK